MISTKYESVDHAKLYSLFRRPPPQFIIAKIIDYVKEKLPSPLDYAVDVGCGPGQSTEVLSPYFRKITGCDASKAQIQEAEASRMKDNLEYLISQAEDLPIEDGSVDLVFSMNSLHWFKRDKFFMEAQRILVPGGVLAVAGQPKFVPFTDNPHKNTVLQELPNVIFELILKPYTSPEVHSFHKEFVDTDFPFDDLQRTTCLQEVFVGTAADYIGFVSSTSSYQNMKAENPNKATRLKSFIEECLIDILGGYVNCLEHVPLNYRAEYFLILGRKPVINQ